MKDTEDKQTKCLLCKVFKATFILTASIISLLAAEHFYEENSLVHSIFLFSMKMILTLP